MCFCSSPFSVNKIFSNNRTFWGLKWNLAKGLMVLAVFGVTSGLAFQWRIIKSSLSALACKCIPMTQKLTYFGVILSAIVRGPPQAMIDTSELCSPAGKQSHRPEWWIYLQCNPQRSQFAKTKHQPHLQPQVLKCWWNSSYFQLHQSSAYICIE